MLLATSIRLLATPMFAIMAILAMLSERAGSHLCLGSDGFMSAYGMTTMYGLMSLVHLAPWFEAARNRLGHIRQDEAVSDR